MKKNPAIFFYLGTLLSSIGSMAFSICLLAFMLRDGYSLFHVSLILGLQRLVPILITACIGHLTDRISPRKTVIVGEFVAALASLGILSAWSQGKSGYEALLVLCLIKSGIVNFQTGSRMKITKLLSDDTYASNSKNAIWFNNATQGATLFAGLCAWPIIQFFDFNTAVWFDLGTFVLNGLLVLALPVGNEKPAKVSAKLESIFQKFSDLYRYNPRAAILDLMLAVSLSGLMSFIGRLAGSDQHWSAILLAEYGLSVWLAGFIESKQWLKNVSKSIWFALGTSFILIGMFPGQGWITVAFSLCKNTCYWLLMHRISASIQINTPQEVMGSVSSARMAQMIVVLSLGELAVGAWQGFMPMAFEGLWRGTFCFAVAAVLALPYIRFEVKNEQPNL